MEILHTNHNGEVSLLGSDFQWSTFALSNSYYNKEKLLITKCKDFFLFNFLKNWMKIDFKKMSEKKNKKEKREIVRK